VVTIIIYSRSLPDGTVGLVEGRDERLCWAGIVLACSESSYS
jgi:hypothetical protein